MNKKLITVLLFPLFFTGCIYINERGISSKYYNECKEYYDSMGIYHKECDKNIIDFKKKRKYE
jgi:hypothetical protein